MGYYGTVDGQGIKGGGTLSIWRSLKILIDVLRKRRGLSKHAANASRALAHHGGTEGTERGFYFFAYREVPIDENKLSYQIRDLRPGISESKSNYGDHGLRTEYFCLSRHLAGQTETFLCVLGASVVNKPCI